ncbi:MAG: ABC transporter ATP-binding protein/permease [Lachnospiraceae bacterium]|nr:ABC transporter ATP-binding protein/permease [Lachnospiraceae bacterium]
MNKLLKYLNNYKKECVLAPLFKMLEAIFELIVPLVISYMIDSGIKGGDAHIILRSFLMLILLGTTGLIVSCTAQFFAAKAATGFSKELRHDIFGHILSFGFREIDNVGTSTMITRATSDVNILQNGVNMFLRLFLRSPFIVAGACVMAFTIDVKCALIFVLVIIALGITVTVITKTNIPLLLSVQKKLDDVLCLVRENLSGARVVRAFTLEEKQVEDFEDTNRTLTLSQLKAGRVSGLLNPLTYVLVNLAIVLLIHAGGVQKEKGILTTGQIVALYNYMSQILLELIKFANLIVTLNRSLASAQRVNSLFEITPSMIQRSDKDATVSEDAEYAVEFENVSLKYHEAADEAVSDISFKIKKGSSFGIIGPTGSGKSTIASLAARFYDATRGIVKIGGKDVKDLDMSSLREHVGIVMQKAVLFEGTIRDNLKWGNPNASDEELLEAAKAAVCLEVIEGKGGLDATVEAGGRNFSGGQRQRLSIARVLAKKPKILILDDSSSALDYMTDKTLRDNVSSLPYDPTVIIISQRTVSVKGCDNILVLDDGQCEGLGDHDQLIGSCEVYKEIDQADPTQEAV